MELSSYDIIYNTFLGCLQDPEAITESILYLVTTDLSWYGTEVHFQQLPMKLFQNPFLWSVWPLLKVLCSLHFFENMVELR